ncbi:MAG: bifunctional sulfate adenylyltransferase/adenylylsulfate kinase [Pyrinomonadaceae bacterium]
MLISPVGSRLIDLEVVPVDCEEVLDEASRLQSVQLSERSVCDLELLATGAFSPLDRFMGRRDFERSVNEMRLADNTVFAIPVALPIDDDVNVTLDSEITLRDSRNNPLAIMTIEEIYEWDRGEFSQHVLGTNDSRHPLIAEMARLGGRNISGTLRVVSLPLHYDFKPLRLTPRQVRRRLETLGRDSVVAFQTRNPIHRAHEELTKRAADQHNASLLIHPAVGLTKPGDVDYFTRVRSYISVVKKFYDPETTLLALLPIAMRMAGPREALWHMLIRRNYGASHFIVGRDHASPGLDSHGKAFYPSDAAEEAARQYGPELGVAAVTPGEIVYLPGSDRYEGLSDLKANQAFKTLSGTQIREEYLQIGKRLPAWFSRPETAKVLEETYPLRNRQGVCVWFTGLSGAGKSTIAEILITLLMESGRRASLLDGDVVRTNLSKGLGFSREDRDTNVTRIGFVASEIVRHGGIAICAAVSPYQATRNEVRGMFDPSNFVEVFVDTPLDVCEDRDAKGLYAKARRGELPCFTGISDPYEVPGNPELTTDTVRASAEVNARAVFAKLTSMGFL